MLFIILTPTPTLTLTLIWQVLFIILTLTPTLTLTLCTCAGGVRRPTCSPPGMMLALCARFEEEPYPTAPMGVSPPIGLTNHGEVQPLGLLCVGC